MTDATDNQDATRFLEQAVELAVKNVADGGGPFGALVVTADGSVHAGTNRGKLRPARRRPLHQL
jgi:guanine deaminase